MEPPRYLGPLLFSSVPPGPGEYSSLRQRPRHGLTPSIPAPVSPTSSDSVTLPPRLNDAPAPPLTDTPPFPTLTDAENGPTLAPMESANSPRGSIPLIGSPPT